jgi:hypothetical protein
MSLAKILRIVFWILNFNCFFSLQNQRHLSGPGGAGNVRLSDSCLLDLEHCFSNGPGALFARAVF